MFADTESDTDFALQFWTFSPIFTLSSIYFLRHLTWASLGIRFLPFSDVYHLVNKLRNFSQIRSILKGLSGLKLSPSSRRNFFYKEYV